LLRLRLLLLPLLLLPAVHAQALAALDGYWQDPGDPGAWIEYRDGRMIEWLDGRRMSASALERSSGPAASDPLDPAGRYLRYLDDPAIVEQIVLLDDHYLQLRRLSSGSELRLRRLHDASDLAAGRQPTLKPAPARQVGGCAQLLLGFDYDASSTLADSGQADYAPFRLADGRTDTAWVEGAAGSGEGEMLALDLQAVKQQRLDDGSGEMPFPEPVEALVLEGLQLVNGYPKSARLFAANGRVAKLDLALDGAAIGSWSLADQAEAQAIAFDPPLLLRRGERLQFKLAQTHAGDRYSDTAIAELLPIVYGCAQILAVD
jgi:hypothetical protein